MNLFNPHSIPICHSGGVTRFPRENFQEISPGILKRNNNEEKVVLYDALKTSIQQSIHQVLESFSSWTWTDLIELSIGNIRIIDVKMVPGQSIFAIPLPTAIMGNVKQGEHCFPNLFWLGENRILIGTTAHNAQQNPIGKTVPLVVSVYTYKSDNAPGWKRVLYSSLSNLSRRESGTALILLATSLELYTDYLFGKYLKSKGILKDIEERILKSAGRWDQKVRRVIPILEERLAKFEKDEFEKHLKNYKEKVRNPRNSYVHEHSKNIDETEVHIGFCAAFELLWIFDQLDTVL